MNARKQKQCKITSTVPPNTCDLAESPLGQDTTVSSDAAESVPQRAMIESDHASKPIDLVAEAVLETTAFQAANMSQTHAETVRGSA